jgi:hypothetical protein
MPERRDRCLTTILAADFAEHGRLMRADEDGDPNQEFFADGVGEDMITAVPYLFVIAPRGTRPHPRNLMDPPRSPRRLAQSLRPWRTSSLRRARMRRVLRSQPCSDVAQGFPARILLMRLFTRDD